MDADFAADCESKICKAFTACLPGQTLSKTTIDLRWEQRQKKETHFFS